MENRLSSSSSTARTAEPRGSESLPRRKTSTTNFSRIYSAGYGGYEQRFQDLTSTSTSKDSFHLTSSNESAMNEVLDEVLPGIPSRTFTATPPPRTGRWTGPSQPMAPKVARDTGKRHNSMELGRPRAARTKSYDSDVFTGGPMGAHPRARTRTLDDGKRHVHSSSGTYANLQPVTSIVEAVGVEDSHNVEDEDRQPIGYPSTVPLSFAAEEQSFSAPQRPASVGPISRTTNRPSSSATRPTPSAARPTSLAGSKLTEEKEKAIDASTAQEKTMYTSAMLARKIKHLMSITRGQMQGDVLLCRAGSTKWTAAYCAISPGSGSLLRESAGHAADDVFVPDIRGCRVMTCLDQWTYTTTLHLQFKTKPFDVYLRPAVPADVYKWQAAFLCWQVIESGQSLLGDSSLLKLIPSVLPSDQDSNGTSPQSTGRESSICKVRKLKMWDPSPDGMGPAESQNNWTTVSCMLRQNGELGIYTVTDVKMIAIVPMSKLSRSAVQRLSHSVLGARYCIAIYPEYSKLSVGLARLRPLYLCCENRVMFEVWFVLLKAFASTELYGPPRLSPIDILRSRESLPGLEVNRKTPSAFRVERRLNLQICDFRDKRPKDEEDVESGSPQMENLEFHTQILIDGHLKARTRCKPGPTEFSWYEHIELLDIPTTASWVSFRLVQTSCNPRNATTDDRASVDRLSQPQAPLRKIDTREQIIGETTVSMEELEMASPNSTRLMLYDDLGTSMGSLTIKSRVDQEFILTDDEYSRISDLLLNISNSLTIDIAERMPQELTRLATHLLDIFQVSGGVGSWLMALAEEEIDGIRKDVPSVRQRFASRLSSSESKENLAPYGPSADRADVVRDINKSVAAEANLLFRGNTLFSKAFDIYMQRLGKDYLEETIGAKVRDVMDTSPDLEVDPQRLSPTACLPYNHVRLLTTTTEFWDLISESANRCPTELRAIFRHVRACAEDRYGIMLRNAPYTAVSGFLFLRFFCPAILNPALFGLTEDSLKPRAQRNFTLIAKLLQGLANGTTFGAKETWMEPMNQFLASHRIEFKKFIDAICAVPPNLPIAPISPSYSAPMQIYTRLPPLAREGYPSLPHLIDYSRSFAALVKLWLDHSTPPFGTSTNGPSIGAKATHLMRFHNECIRITQLSTDLFNQADRVELNNVIDPTAAWSALARRMDTQPGEFWTVESTSASVDANAHSAPGAIGLEPDLLTQNITDTTPNSTASIMVTPTPRVLQKKKKYASSTTSSRRPASSSTPTFSGGMYYIPDADDPSAVHFGPDPAVVMAAARRKFNRSNSNSRPSTSKDEEDVGGRGVRIGRFSLQSRSRSRPGSSRLRAEERELEGEDDGGVEDEMEGDRVIVDGKESKGKQRKSLFGRKG